MLPVSHVRARIGVRALLAPVRRVGVVVGVAVGLIASHAWAQAPSPSPTPAPSPSGTNEPSLPSVITPLRTPQSPGPPISSYPVEFFGLLAPSAQRGPFALTPSISISEEFNDNIFADNQNRQWHFITNISPVITLSLNQPSYQLSPGYTFTSQIYAKESSLNRVFESQTFLATGSYLAAQGLTFTASDSFV